MGRSSFHRQLRKTQKRLFHWAVGIFIIVIAASLAFYVYDYYTYNYDSWVDPEKYPLLGIDVSNHQGTIDWTQVRGARVEFAFIKATEGADFKDQSFARNVRKARENNIKIGAYHFFRFDKSGEEQARNFIDSYDFQIWDFPPVLDVEEYRNFIRTKNISLETSEIKQYLEILQTHYNVKPIIYTNPKTYASHIKGHFDEYPLWIANLKGEPDDYTWLFWQYTHRGELPGIEGDVDLNTFNGTFENMVLYLRKSHKMT